MASTQRRIGGAFAAPTPTLPILDALNNALVSIRQHNPGVPNVVIVLGTSSRLKLGHFHAGQWDGRADHEIMLSGESLARDAVDVFGTLLHEAVHAYCHVEGIKDTSRQGRFHNGLFKATGEAFGLVLAKQGSIGWSATSVPPATRKLYAKEISTLRKALKTYRRPASAPASKPRTTIRLFTPSGRALTVPISFHLQGDIFDAKTGELFAAPPEDDGWRDENPELT